MFEPISRQLSLSEILKEAGQTPKWSREPDLFEEMVRGRAESEALLQEFRFDAKPLSRQGSGVFLRDPNVQLGSTWLTEEKPHHEQLSELYDCFANDSSSSVSIIPLTPTQVTMLTTSPQSDCSSESGRRTRRESEDSDYRRRRDRNNMAVRKSRAKSRAREQSVDHRLGALLSSNETLKKRVDSVIRELKFLRTLMHKTRIPLPQGLASALTSYPDYFDSE